MKIELSPDWILDKLTFTHYADGEGNVTICADCNNTPWVELALDTLNISYIQEEYIDENDDINTSYDFKLEDIKECTITYNQLSELNKNNYERRFRKNIN